MASGWYNRFHWTRFKTELDNLAIRWHGGKLLNVGCGHGADFLPFAEKFELYGVDFSSEMLKFAQTYSKKFNFHVDLRLADARKLPFTDDYFDNAISVATLHHLEGPAEILVALGELFRVLKPGGEAFITFWNRSQPRFWFKPRQVWVPWRSGKTILNRYYYLVNYPEARILVKRAGFILIECKPEKSYRLPVKYFSRNICLLVRKPL